MIQHPSTDKPDALDNYRREAILEKNVLGPLRALSEVEYETPEDREEALLSAVKDAGEAFWSTLKRHPQLLTQPSQPVPGHEVRYDVDRDRDSGEVLSWSVYTCHCKTPWSHA